jgi:hypothetical protein
MRIVMLAVAMLFAVGQVHAADRGYFNCLRTNMTDKEKAAVADWFSADQKVRSCCDLSDGMPGFAEDRADGIYIAPRAVTFNIAQACRDNPNEPLGTPPPDHSDWIKVASDKILIRNNPIGVAVVWWYTGPNQDGTWDPRCFADLPKT